MMPVSGGFLRLAGEWVDEAFGFMAGWNFFIYEALLSMNPVSSASRDHVLTSSPPVPFEITALITVLSFWRDDIPAAAVIAACIVCYA